jgi:hypothetical protein
LGFLKEENNNNNITGKDLINYCQNIFDDPKTRSTIKFIMRASLENIIENPLVSKEIFK